MLEYILIFCFGIALLSGSYSCQEGTNLISQLGDYRGVSEEQLWKDPEYKTVIKILHKLMNKNDLFLNGKVKDYNKRLVKKLYDPIFRPGKRMINQRKDPKKLNNIILIPNLSNTCIKILSRHLTIKESNHSLKTTGRYQKHKTKCFELVLPFSNRMQRDVLQRYSDYERKGFQIDSKGNKLAVVSIPARTQYFRYISSVGMPYDIHLEPFIRPGKRDLAIKRQTEKKLTDKDTSTSMQNQVEEGKDIDKDTDHLLSFLRHGKYTDENTDHLLSILRHGKYRFRLKEILKTLININFFSVTNDKSLRHGEQISTKDAFVSPYQRRKALTEQQTSSLNKRLLFLINEKDGYSSQDRSLVSPAILEARRKLKSEVGKTSSGKSVEISKGLENSKHNKITSKDAPLARPGKRATPFHESETILREAPFARPGKRNQ